MDVDAFVLAHRPTWDRLDVLVKRRRRLTGAEVDELVELYQRVSTHLSMVRTASSDSVLVGRLSSLVARARSAVTSAHAPLWSEFVRFWTVSFPVVAYRCWRWWVGTAVAFFAVTVIIALWVCRQPRGAGKHRDAQRDRRIGQPRFRVLLQRAPGGVVRAAGVDQQLRGWPGQCIAFAILLGIPIPYVLFQNAANLGVIAGLMFHAGKGDIMLGLLTPHGLLELTAVFLAGAAGMRLGWTVVSPGNRPRGQVLAEQGRAVVAVAVGLVAVLLVAGADRGARHAIAACRHSRASASACWPRAGFLFYVIHFGRKAVAGRGDRRRGRSARRGADAVT